MTTILHRAPLARDRSGKSGSEGDDAPFDGLHRALDFALVKLVRPLGLLYPDGFGANFDERVAAVRDFHGQPGPIDIRFGPTRLALGFPVREGRFRSPAASYLPPESHDAVFEQWLPRATLEPDTPVCLVLASTGEEGALRRRPIARFLAAHGISAIILENPYYGARRPRGQWAAAIRTAADQFAMNLATCEEAMALLSTFHAGGHDVGTTGYSQGGAISAFAAAFSDFSLAAVPRAAPIDVAPIFTVHALSQSVHWGVLAREAGSLEAARERMCDALRQARIDSHPPPRDPRRAIVVAHRSDAFIPVGDAAILHRHWRGSELRYVDGGHVTGLALHHRDHWQAVLDAFAR